MKTKLVVTSCRTDGMIDKKESFMHYIYNGRGLAIKFRQHILQEVLRLNSGEIGYIRITAQKKD